jgi:hypothetical protein
MLARVKSWLQRFGAGGKHHAPPHDEQEKREAMERAARLSLRVNSLILSNMAQMDERLADEE